MACFRRIVGVTCSTYIKVGSYILCPWSQSLRHEWKHGPRRRFRVELKWTRMAGSATYHGGWLLKVILNIMTNTNKMDLGIKDSRHTRSYSELLKIKLAYYIPSCTVRRMSQGLPWAPCKLLGWDPSSSNKATRHEFMAQGRYGTSYLSDRCPGPHVGLQAFRQNLQVECDLAYTSKLMAHRIVL